MQWQNAVGLGVKGERSQGQPDEVRCAFHPPGFHSGDEPKRAVAAKNCFYKERAKLRVIYSSQADFFLSS